LASDEAADVRQRDGADGKKHYSMENADTN
jgi:hypothetical protein